MNHSELVSAIGVLADDGDPAVLVPRASHLDGVGQSVGEKSVRRVGLWVSGPLPPVGPGVLVAVLGHLVDSQLTAVAARTANVADVFGRQAALVPSAKPAFQPPIVSAAHDRWEMSRIDEGRIVSRRRLKASDGSWRVVVTAPEPDDVRSELERAYGDQLTLLRSAWTREQFDRIRRYLMARLDDWTIGVLADGTTVDGLPVLRAALREVTDEVQMWLDELPAGAVELYPFVVRDPSTHRFNDKKRLFHHMA